MPLDALPTEDVIGYQVTTLTRAGVRALVARWLAEPIERPRVFDCANPHSLHVAATDPAFAAALREADLLTPDGVGIVIGSKLKGGAIRDRITGHDVFTDTCEVLAERGGSVFFLGSSEKVLADLRRQMAIDYPDVRIAGTCSPPFKPVFSEADDAAMIAAVNEARPDVLWVGMTAPKQEKWIAANRDRLDTRFIGAIGAVFDFYSGNKHRSSPLFQRLGMEWLPRLVREPKRLWRRNFVSAPAFFWRVLRS